MTPPARKNGATTTPPPTCGFPVGGTTPCGDTAVWQAPWKVLYGYADKPGNVPLCPLHAGRFPEVTSL